MGHKKTIRLTYKRNNGHQAWCANENGGLFNLAKFIEANLNLEDGERLWLILVKDTAEGGEKT